MIPGMSDHLVIHAAHPFMASTPLAVRETIHYLRNGKFRQKDE